MLMLRTFPTRGDNMDAWARGLHVLGVVLWIGGVAFVTWVLLPAVARMKTESERVAFFESVEARFATVARYATLLVGITGFWMIERWQLWNASLWCISGGCMPWSQCGSSSP